MNDAPWKDSTLEIWIKDIIYPFMKDSSDQVAKAVKDLLLSNQTNDQLQYPIFELLGEESFDAIEVLLSFRETMLKERISEVQKKQQPKAFPSHKPVIRPCPMARLSGHSRYINTETANASIYDVEATSLQKPKVKRKPLYECEDWVQQCFQGCEEFNDIQSQIFETGFNKNSNMLICAPTGAGKTNVALLTILHELKRRIVDIPGVPPHINDDPFLIVYITPMKALATEITGKFASSLRHLRVHVHEYTGDTSLTSDELDKSHILVATPEKWDVATRRAGENAPCQRIRLLIIDEIHLLQDDRGPVLEALVARTLRQVEQSQRMIRIVGLSATLPNYLDVAAFLRVPDDGLFFFGPEYRPVPLSMSLIGAKNTLKTPDKFQEDIFKEIMIPGRERDIVQEDVIAIALLKKLVAEGNQILVFVHTRNETARFAHLIAKYCDITISDELNHQLARKSLQPQLRDCLAQGVGIHHAGLPRADRIFAENAFRSNAFPVLVCTATLAWGVNLPAHTVLIKGTQVYNNEHGGFEDIGILDVHQMFGRAGRPQFDSSGHAILITQQKVLSKYTSTLVNAEPIESKFQSKIEDFLNAEISLGTVTSRRDALIWARYTFMYQRLPDDETTSARIDLAIDHLAKNLMIRQTLASMELQPTHLGQVASIHYIPYMAVKHFNEHLNGDMDESALLDCVFASGMFENLIVRQNELPEMEDFKPVIPILTSIDEVPGKVSFLLQTYISRYRLKTMSLHLDQAWIADNMGRIFSAIFELTLEKGWCFLAMFALDLCKMVAQQMWWCRNRIDNPMRQFMSFPRDEGLIRKLDFMSLTIDNIKASTYEELCAILRNDFWAKQAMEYAERFPIVEIETGYQTISDQVINIKIGATFPFKWTKEVCKDKLTFWIFIEDGDGTQMFIAQEVIIDKRLARDGHNFQFMVPLPESHRYTVSMISTRYLGVGDSQSVFIQEGDKLTFKTFESLPPNIRPLPTRAIQSWKNIFDFPTFNPVQSQVFFQCYHTDESLLVGCPTFSGRKTIAEICIAKNLENYPNSKTLYISPIKARISEVVADWKIKFGNRMIELSGDFAPDSIAVARAQIIVATPDKWDAVSRGIAVRQFVERVSTIIIDDIDLLGIDRGHVTEAVVCRMRRLQVNLRFIALGRTLPNPLDIANWLDIPERGRYNFPQKMREIPLKMYIRGFPGRHYNPRMAAMNKPLSDAIKEYSIDLPTHVFVSSRKQARLTAFDLISYANFRGEPFCYVTPFTAEASQLVKDKDLAHCLSFGVGLHHSGLSNHDTKIIEDLMISGHLNLLVATSGLAWGTKIFAHFVVIKGTEYYDPKTAQYVPYTMIEIQKMMERAGRKGIDSEGSIMILCEESRKDFLKCFVNTPFPIESAMPGNITEHANAEVSAGRITNKGELMEWLSCTYFAVRLKANPHYYNNVTLEKVATTVLSDLEKNLCVSIGNGGTITPNPEGKIASIFYVRFSTVKQFVGTMEAMSDIPSILRFICLSKEISEFPIRRNEDEVLRTMNVRYPINSTLDSPHAKAFYLLQQYFSRKKMPNVDFQLDLDSIINQVLRLVGCFAEIAAIRGSLYHVINATIIGQMIIQGAWYDESHLEPLVDKAVLLKLHQMGVSVLPQLIMQPKLPSVFQNIKDNVLLYKPAQLLIARDRHAIRIILTKVSGEIGRPVISEKFQRRTTQNAVIIIGEPSTGKLLSHRRVQLKKHSITVDLESDELITENVWIYILSDCYLGIDQMFPLNRNSISRLPSVDLDAPRELPEYEGKEKIEKPIEDAHESQVKSEQQKEPLVKPPIAMSHKERLVKASKPPKRAGIQKKPPKQQPSSATIPNSSIWEQRKVPKQQPTPVFIPPVQSSHTEIKKSVKTQPTQTVIMEKKKMPKQQPTPNFIPSSSTCMSAITEVTKTSKQQPNPSNIPHAVSSMPAMGEAMKGPKQPISEQAVAIAEAIKTSKEQPSPAFVPFQQKTQPTIILSSNNEQLVDKQSIKAKQKEPIITALPGSNVPLKFRPGVVPPPPPGFSPLPRAGGVPPVQLGAPIRMHQPPPPPPGFYPLPKKGMDLKTRSFSTQEATLPKPNTPEAKRSEQPNSDEASRKFNNNSSEYEESNSHKQIMNESALQKGQKAEPKQTIEIEVQRVGSNTRPPLAVSQKNSPWESIEIEAEPEHLEVGLAGADQKAVQAQTQTKTQAQAQPRQQAVVTGEAAAAEFGISIEGPIQSRASFERPFAGVGPGMRRKVQPPEPGSALAMEDFKPLSSRDIASRRQVRSRGRGGYSGYGK